MTIIYFTATGNSLAVAKAVGGEIKSIPQLISDEEYVVEDDTIGIIVPCFGCSIPRIVKEYLSKAKLEASYIFACVTSASMPGNALGELKHVLSLNGNHLDYGKDIKMMNNYLVWSSMEKESELLKTKNVDEQIDLFVNDIKNKRKHIPNKNVFSKLATYFADYSRFKWSNTKTSNFDRKFTVNDKCTGCKVCEKVCPANNIEVNLKPIFKHQCEACLACIHNCPRTALHYVKEKSSGRYRNDKVTLLEIINSNHRR